MATHRGGRAQVPGIVWERPEPSEKPTPSALSRERIVSAAIALADEGGLAAVSLRKVATALDAGPMRLYGYISTKDELLELLLDTVYSEIELPDDTVTDWRQRLRLLARGSQQAAQRHEWFVELLGGRPNLGPHAMAHTEAVSSTLHRYAGFSDLDIVMQAGSAFSAYVIGALRSELAQRRAERGTGMTREEWQRASGEYLRRQLDTGQYPTVAKIVHAPSHPERSIDFEDGLEYVLDGIAARLPPRLRLLSPNPFPGETKP